MTINCLSSITSRFTLAVLTLWLLALAPLTQAKTMLVTAIRPGLLVLVDAEARKIERTYPLPKTSPGNGPFSVVVSKDGRVAYVVHNRWRSISGINLDTGEEVFRADLPAQTPRSKSLAIDISPDGKELAVSVLPVKILDNEYQVQDTFIAIFDTAAGIGAKPVRTFPVPRRTATLAYSPDGERLYALSWDIHVLDPKDGREIGRHELRHWGRKNFGEPDAITMFPQWEQSGIIALTYYVARTDRKPDAPDAFMAGIYMLDLAADKVRYKEFENATVGMASGVVNPVRTDEVFSVFNHLGKTDMKTGKLIKRVELDQTFYNANMSPDGREIYIGGGGSMIQVYDSKTMKRLGVIRMPGDADLAFSSLRVVNR